MSPETRTRVLSPEIEVRVLFDIADVIAGEFAGKSFSSVLFRNRVNAVAGPQHNPRISLSQLIGPDETELVILGKKDTLYATLTLDQETVRLSLTGREGKVQQTMSELETLGIQVSDFNILPELDLRSAFKTVRRTRPDFRKKK